MGRKDSLDCFIITALALMEMVGVDVGAPCLGDVRTQVPAEGPGPPGCRWPLLGRPRPQTGRGPAAPMALSLENSAGPGCISPP